MASTCSSFSSSSCTSSTSSSSSNSSTTLSSDSKQSLTDFEKLNLVFINRPETSYENYAAVKKLICPMCHGYASKKCMFHQEITGIIQCSSCEIHSHKCCLVKWSNYHKFEQLRCPICEQRIS